MSGPTLEKNLVQDGDISDATYRYIEQLLTEDNGDEWRTFHNPLALQAMEDSFYQVLVRNEGRCLQGQGELDRDNWDSTSKRNAIGRSVDPSFSPVEEQGRECSASASMPITHLNDKGCTFTRLPNASLDIDFAQHNLSKSECILQFLRAEEEASKFLLQQMPVTLAIGYKDSSIGQIDSSPGARFALDSLNRTNSILQYKRGIVRTHKFLTNLQGVSGSEINKGMHPMWKDNAAAATVDTVKYPNECLASGTMGSKNGHVNVKGHGSENLLTVDAVENQLSAWFERLLLSPDVQDKTLKRVDDRAYVYEVPEIFPHYTQLPGSSAAGKSIPTKKRRYEEKGVDLWRLLIDCAQALATDDKSVVEILLKEIRLHSSPSGNAIQRLSYYSADALKARSVGNVPNLYPASKIKPVSELKAHTCLASVCPFSKMGSIFRVYNTLKLAETAVVLHIVDFGILSGFQWAVAIYNLSRRQGGPPKLRITGIEDPQQDFVAGQIFEKTGPRLAEYCKRWNVPFEYNGILKKWEEIQVEDIKRDQNEAVVVTCMLRLEKMPDEIDGLYSPRDAVLSLILKINPDVFIHFINSGSHNVPAFLQRFQQTIYHYSKLFDMLDSILPHDNEVRMMIEKEIFGSELLNIIACEGSDRVERVETYKQWQARTHRAGFRQLSMDVEIVRKLTAEVKARYHKDFDVEKDGEWLLQGWKGRTLCALTCWAPAPQPQQ